MVRISKQYRSILRDCQEMLDKWVDDQNTIDSDRQTYTEQSELLYKLELMWHLLEIVCIEKQAIILPGLLQWIGLHFPSCDEKARNVLGATSATGEDQIDDQIENPETHPDYWEAIVLFVIQGRTENARKLLRLHTEVSSGPFVSLDELLRKMPRYMPGQTSADFEFRWRQWQTEVVARIEEGDFATVPNLVVIAKILAGDENTFQTQVKPKCETWYEYLIGKMLYTNPSVRIYDLPYHAEEAIGLFGGLSTMTTLDSVLLAAMEMDIPQVSKS